MSTPLRLAGFLAVLVVTFVAAMWVGSTIDPIREQPPSHGVAR